MIFIILLIIFLSYIIICIINTIIRSNITILELLSDHYFLIWIIFQYSIGAIGDSTVSSFRNGISNDNYI